MAHYSDNYGGGGHHTRLRDPRDQLLCLWGAPGHVYKGVEEGERAGPYGAPWRSPTPTGSRIAPLSLVGLGENEGGEREEGKGPPLLVQFGPEGEGEGARGLPWLPLSLH